MSLQGIAMRGLGNLGTFQTGTVASLVGVQWAVALGALVCIAMTLTAGTQVPGILQYTGRGQTIADLRLQIADRKD